jgi:hypothetical protein
MFLEVMEASEYDQFQILTAHNHCSDQDIRYPQQGHQPIRATRWRQAPTVSGS